MKKTMVIVIVVNPKEGSGLLKKLLFIVLLFGSVFISGCSFLGEVNNTIEYVNDTTAYINELSNFADDAPQMIQNAVTDPSVKEELDNQLHLIVEEIETFQAIEPPAIAEQIHQQIVDNSETLLQQINEVLNAGENYINLLENSPIFETINNMNSFLKTLEELGQ
ncbi:DUF6376 family protein [Caldibacillus lycopersici]|uniref:DUF6376 family protein n=1 Tax=Perspicuibacillus lycopersici TaxID=1325689 RepID=A0AAE3IUF5_9BACI|nr:DUF6376 family protein [Perspicuibacillus lycopersici]MCU9614632.1 DUF6376 family protein [Perspicuibacillus lycopersici]